ncbi:MAG: S-formylglutathione hydrolase [Pseudomonadota bacterium]|nr:S-formylglutathione hydrolase [Pseudomonadota bacterium]
MLKLTAQRCFGGEQRFYQHYATSTQCEMKFGVYVPPQALAGQACPAVIYLAGLTCTEETFAIKAHAQQMAAELGLILISPDTSPRGDDVAQGDHWDIGQGAGFYLNATQAPWAAHYQMERYIVDELYALIQQHFQPSRLSLMGHSMGGHGALTLAFRHPEQFASVSAIAPIVAPVDVAWGQKAFSAYLGEDQTLWSAHDASRLIMAQGRQFDEILVDQGLADQFLSQLMPERLEAACQAVAQPLILRRHEGYDHGYYFIKRVIEDHLRFHAHQAGVTL